MIRTLMHAITLHTSENAELKKARLEDTFLFLLQQRRASLGCNSQRLSSLYFSKGLLGRWISSLFCATIFVQSTSPFFRHTSGKHASAMVLSAVPAVPSLRFDMRVTLLEAPNRDHLFEVISSPGKFG